MNKPNPHQIICNKINDHDVYAVINALYDDGHIGSALRLYFTIVVEDKRNGLISVTYEDGKIMAKNLKI